ncbi:hypothetical protein GCM10009549_37810 [Streptomyces thermoalcalitolerans]|uniref:Uncharacterized protein n=1 Tax=Streptomyces thermoalcalitolerans TaxID=65605 RepID=A0ABN1NZ44_9ACTN
MAATAAGTATPVRAAGRETPPAMEPVTGGPSGMPPWPRAEAVATPLGPAGAPARSTATGKRSASLSPATAKPGSAAHADGVSERAVLSCAATGSASPPRRSRKRLDSCNFRRQRAWTVNGTVRTSPSARRNCAHRR